MLISALFYAYLLNKRPTGRTKNVLVDSVVVVFCFSIAMHISGSVQSYPVKLQYEFRRKNSQVFRSTFCDSDAGGLGTTLGMAQMADLTSVCFGPWIIGFLRVVPGKAWAFDAEMEDDKANGDGAAASVQSFISS